MLLNQNRQLICTQMNYDPPNQETRLLISQEQLTTNPQPSSGSKQQTMDNPELPITPDRTLLPRVSFGLGWDGKWAC